MHQTTLGSEVAKFNDQFGTCKTNLWYHISDSISAVELKICLSPQKGADPALLISQNFEHPRYKKCKLDFFLWIFMNFPMHFASFGFTTLPQKSRTALIRGKIWPWSQSGPNGNCPDETALIIMADWTIGSRKKEETGQIFLRKSTHRQSLDGQYKRRAYRTNSRLLSIRRPPSLAPAPIGVFHPFALRPVRPSVRLSGDRTDGRR